MEKNREILKLFPSLNLYREVSGNSKEGMNSCLEILEKAANNGYVTQYALTRKLKHQPKPLKNVATARACLKKLLELGLLQEKQKPNLKGRSRKESSLTAKGVIACLVFMEFQKTDRLKAVLESSIFHGDKLAALLRIYNQGYAQRTLFPPKTAVTPCVDIAKKLVSQEGLNLEIITEEKLVQKLRSVVDEEFLTAIRRKQSVDEWILMSLQNSDFLKTLLLIAENSNGLQPEDTQKGIKQSIHSILVMTSPEFLAWMVLQQQKKADIPQTLKRLKETIAARTAGNSTPFEGPQDVIDRSLDAMRDLMLEELSQA